MSPATVTPLDLGAIGFAGPSNWHCTVKSGMSGREDLIPEAYASFAAPIFAAFTKPVMVTKESDVAEAVWQAANDASGQLRFPAGSDAVALARTN